MKITFVPLRAVRKSFCTTSLCACGQYHCRRSCHPSMMSPTRNNVSHSMWRKKSSSGQLGSPACRDARRKSRPCEHKGAAAGVPADVSRRLTAGPGAWSLIFHKARDAGMTAPRQTHERDNAEVTSPGRKGDWCPRVTQMQSVHLHRADARWSGDRRQQRASAQNTNTCEVERKSRGDRCLVHQVAEDLGELEHGTVVDPRSPGTHFRQSLDHFGRRRSHRRARTSARHRRPARAPTARCSAPAAWSRRCGT